MADNQPCNRRDTPRPFAERTAHEAAGIEHLSAAESLSRIHAVCPMRATNAYLIDMQDAIV